MQDRNILVDIKHYFYNFTKNFSLFTGHLTKERKAAETAATAAMMINDVIREEEEPITSTDGTVENQQITSL